MKKVLLDEIRKEPRQRGCTNKQLLAENNITRSCNQRHGLVSEVIPNKKKKIQMVYMTRTKSTVNRLVREMDINTRRQFHVYRKENIMNKLKN